jgi:hypothetical protein
LVFVAQGEVARAFEVFGGAVNLVFDSGKSVLEAFFDE